MARKVVSKDLVKGHSLVTLASYFECEGETAHRALADCLMLGGGARVPGAGARGSPPVCALVECPCTLAAFSSSIPRGLTCRRNCSFIEISDAPPTIHNRHTLVFFCSMTSCVQLNLTVCTLCTSVPVHVHTRRIVLPALALLLFQFKLSPFEILLGIADSG